MMDRQAPTRSSILALIRDHRRNIARLAERLEADDLAPDTFGDLGALEAVLDRQVRRLSLLTSQRSRTP